MGYLATRQNATARLPQPAERVPDFDEQLRTLKRLANAVDEVLEREQRLYARILKRAKVDAPELAREDAPNGLAFRSGAEVLAHARSKGMIG